jgi:hypothetical protein
MFKKTDIQKKPSFKITVNFSASIKCTYLKTKYTTKSKYLIHFPSKPPSFQLMVLINKIMVEQITCHPGVVADRIGQRQAQTEKAASSGKEMETNSEKYWYVDCLINQKV